MRREHKPTVLVVDDNADTRVIMRWMLERWGCRVLMDLPGPNPRTGPSEPGPRAVSWSPRCDPAGRAEAPCASG